MIGDDYMQGVLDQNENNHMDSTHFNPSEFIHDESKNDNQKLGQAVKVGKIEIVENQESIGENEVMYTWVPKQQPETSRLSYQTMEKSRPVSAQPQRLLVRTRNANAT